MQQMDDKGLQVQQQKPCAFCKDGQASEKALGLHDIAVNPEAKFDIGISNRCFNLGNNQIFDNIDDAANAFLQREYARVLSPPAEGNGPIFIPEFFLSSIPKVLDYDYRKTGLPLPVVKDEGIPRGEKVEYKLFREVKDFFTNTEKSSKTKDLVVFRGYQWYEDASTNMKNKAKNRVRYETDLLVVSGSQKIILSIECKAKAKKNAASSVVKQHLKLQEHLQQKFAFDEGWKLVKAFAFEDQENDFVICASCSKFKIHLISEQQGHGFADLWSHLEDACSVSGDHPREGFIEVFRRLAFYTHHDFVGLTKSPLACSNAKLKDVLERASEPANIKLWTKHQYSTLHVMDTKKVLLASAFGTGKSILLRYKAKLLANAIAQRHQEGGGNSSTDRPSEEEGVMVNDRIEGQDVAPPPVIVLIMPSTVSYLDEKMMLVEQTRLECNSKNDQNIRIMTWKDVANEVRMVYPDITTHSDILRCFLRQNKSSPGIFIDEFSTHFIYLANHFEANYRQFCEEAHKIFPLLVFALLTAPQCKRFFCQVLQIIGQFIMANMEEICEILSQSMDVQRMRHLFGSFRSGEDNPKLVLGNILQVCQLFLQSSDVRSDQFQRIINLIHDSDSLHRVGTTYNMLDINTANKLKGLYDKMSLGFHSTGAPGFLDSLAKEVSEDTFLWIAINKNDNDYRRFGEQAQHKAFQRIDLQYNVRSSLSIVRKAKEARHDKCVDCREVQHFEGQPPLVINVDCSTCNSVMEMGLELFKCFKEALQWLLSTATIDDVLITWDLLLGPALDELFNHIVDYCQQEENGIPIHVGMKRYSERGLGNSIDFLNKRRHASSKGSGILIADMGCIQGCEFTSVIAFFRKTSNGTRHSFQTRRSLTTADVMLRAMCNLAIIDCKMENFSRGLEE